MCNMSMLVEYPSTSAEAIGQMWPAPIVWTAGLRPINQHGPTQAKLFNEISGARNAFGGFGLRPGRADQRPLAMSHAPNTFCPLVVTLPHGSSVRGS